MKAFICEMCNSQELVKQDGFFVCQSCGTRYSVEEAKKLMVEIEGTVKVDNSDYVQRYLQNARRAKSKEDWAEVEKYYNMVEQNQPDNIEAIFYSAYGKAKQSLIENDIFKRQATFQVLMNSVSIIDDNYDISKETELRPILESIAKDIIAMHASGFVYQTNQYGDNKGKTYSLFGALMAEAAISYYNIWNKFPDHQRQSVAYIANTIIQLSQPIIRLKCPSAKRLELARKCDEIELALKSFFPDYQLQQYEQYVNAKYTRPNDRRETYIILGIVTGVVLVFWIVAYLILAFL